MRMLSEDDMNLEGMSDEELALAWDLWFDLAQATNDSDPPFTHGVWVNTTWEDLDPSRGLPAEDPLPRDRSGDALRQGG